MAGLIRNACSALGISICVVSHAALAADVLLEEARAGAYSATGLYEPVVTRFDNGLTLITNRRTGVRAVTVRIHVGLGSAHYECGQRQIPHYLEHMLYDSVPGMSESQFETRMAEFGGRSNARTESTATVFELDVFSGTALDALDLTADMIFEARLREESFRKVRGVIYQEMGGQPSPLEAETYVGGKLASGTDKAFADIAGQYFGLCGQWDGGQDLDHESIVQAYAEHYVPGNMVWIVVGDFDREDLDQWAENTLAALPRAELPASSIPAIGRFSREEYRGFQSEPGIMLAALTDGLLGEDFYARSVLVSVLSDRLYDRLRLQEGLAYSPYATETFESTFGILILGTDADEPRHRQVMQWMREVVAEVRSEPLPFGGSMLKWEKIAVLRDWAQAIETNADYAEYYIGRLPQFRRDGHFLNEEVAVAQLTAEDLRRVARELLADDRLVEIYEADIQAMIRSAE